mgnify:FL=1
MHNKIDLTSLALAASKKEPEWNRYLQKNKKKIESLDLKIHELHDEVVEKINCLECANCCRTLGPRITDKDLEKMGKALRMKPVDVIQKYLRIDEDGDMVFRTMPCPFLGSDNYCSIYESRPKACREYPHTDRKKFFQIYKLSVKNASTCPIVFEVLNRIPEL